MPDPIIIWIEGKRKLSELIQWEHNPRQSTVATVEKLEYSYKKFGQPEPILIGPHNELYDGHQRLSAWAENYGDIEVDVRVASRELSEDERRELTVLLHAGATGQWNWDAFSTWDADALQKWGIDQQMLNSLNTDATAIREMLSSTFSYEPMMEPEIGSIKVDAGDILKEKNRLEEQFNQDAEYVQVTCPHCGQDFYLDRKDLKK